MEKKSLLIIPIMAGYSSNLAKKFFTTEQFPQQILPLLPLYNAQWLGYESLTAIVLVNFWMYFILSGCVKCSFRIGLSVIL